MDPVKQHIVYRVTLHLGEATEHQICRVKDFCFGEAAQWKDGRSGVERLFTWSQKSGFLPEVQVQRCVNTKTLLPTCWCDHGPVHRGLEGGLWQESLVLGGSALVLLSTVKEYYRDVFGSMNGGGIQCKFLPFANKDSGKMAAG